MTTVDAVVQSICTRHYIVHSEFNLNKINSIIYIALKVFIHSKLHGVLSL